MLLDLVPTGFEERETSDGLELAAYVRAGDEAPLLTRFPTATSTPVEPGWEDAWRAFHRGVRIGRVWVGPPWERPEDDALAVVIDPGRAFGTGAHPTTQLCVELLQSLERGSLADLGCGSGVLALAAARLGFAPVLALDADPAAIEATRANAAANRVELEARRADVLVERSRPVRVAVANIALPVVESLAGRVDADVFITSGYLAGDRVRLAGWREEERRERDGWAAHVFRRTSAAGLLKL